jgi:hypothetical protein
VSQDEVRPTEGRALPDLADWIRNAQIRHDRIVKGNDLQYRDMALLLRAKAEWRVARQVERWLSSPSPLVDLRPGTLRMAAQRHHDRAIELAEATGKTSQVIDAVVRASALAEAQIWIKLLDRL